MAAPERVGIAHIAGGLAALNWRPGDQVLHRYLRDGRVFWALPVTVAADGAEEFAVWVAPGTPMRRPTILRVGVRALASGDWRLAEASWFGEGILMLRRAGTRHAVWHFWDPGGRFRGWYVNLEQWERNAQGVDAHDHLLDLWIYTDGSWRWKDEEDLAEAIELGYVAPDEGAAIRAEGERVLAEWPFPTGWEDWRPDPAWPVPSLPAG